MNSKNADSTSDDQVFGLLSIELRQPLIERNYSHPTPIQAESIPMILDGGDVLGCAQTGTGKTAAFVLPVLQHLIQLNEKAQPQKPKALVIAPTRELAQQIVDECQYFSSKLPISAMAIYGGVDIEQQIEQLHSGVDIVVATPGRLMDLMEREEIAFDDLSHLILDEADRMLDMGFIPDIRKIVAALPRKRQTLFFSATMGPRVTKLAESILVNARQVRIRPDTVAVEDVDQSVYFVSQENKTNLLVHLIKTQRMNKVVVFTRTRQATVRVTSKLNGSGIKAVAINGDKTQKARNRALERFKNGSVNVLVATDVASRGLDVDAISHVFNYDLPEESESYVHRIGRTARAGAKGISISFCNADELEFLRQIEDLLGQGIPPVRGHRYHAGAARAANSTKRDQQAEARSQRKRSYRNRHRHPAP